MEKDNKKLKKRTWRL